MAASAANLLEAPPAPDRVIDYGAGQVLTHEQATAHALIVSPFCKPHCAICHGAPADMVLTDVPMCGVCAAKRVDGEAAALPSKVSLCVNCWKGRGEHTIVGDFCTTWNERDGVYKTSDTRWSPFPESGAR